MLSSLYYAFELAGFLAILWWQGRGKKNEAVESVNATLIASQQQLITTQAGQLALVQKQNEDQAEQIAELQGQNAELQRELDILKEAIRGSAQVVHP